MGPTLRGAETELVVGIRHNRPGNATPGLYQFALAMLQQMLPPLPRQECGIYTSLMLRQSSRIFLDRPFLDLATPEVRRPEEAIAYRRAGERLLLTKLPNAAKAEGIKPQLIARTRAVIDDVGAKSKPMPKNRLSKKDSRPPKNNRDALLPGSRPIIFNQFHVRRRR